MMDRRRLLSIPESKLHRKEEDYAFRRKLAEILNFQGAKPCLGVGRFS